MDYRLYAVRVFVRDWDAAVRFYTETLGIPLAFRNDDIGWAELDTGEGRLALERLDADDPEAGSLVGRFVGVSLAVPDVHAAHAELTERGVEFVGAPEIQPWGGVLAHLRDPEGNVLTLLSRETSSEG